MRRAVKTRSRYWLLGLMLGLLLGGLMGLLLGKAMQASVFHWLAAIGAILGLWLGGIVDRSRFKVR